ncbi:uroporphyrinogen-III synthase [Limnohabitans sp.]|uniref:uroporphyrinogen-III synthase n=1 Tax=Limnohabitans sp. TaxID=1907725 RepID=UPI00286F3FBF|nr:uroporphyrinogen-III synthase [Limnohabitans sp.]
MRVVITRPAGDAQAWVDALHAAGHEALALPLIDVGPATNTQAVLQTWAHWPEWQAVMFVSAQAVRYFFDCQPSALRAEVAKATGAMWANGPRCWATGPGTHRALLQAGVPEACIDSPAADAVQFDSEALWQRVSCHIQRGKPVLIVRGKDVQASADADLVGTGRDWLAQQIQAAGATAHFVVAYERRAPVWTDAQKTHAALAATNGDVWCFSSSQAIQHLAQALPLQSWGNARCMATHARIAQTAQVLGFGEVNLSRPSVADVLGSLECLA